MRAVFATWWNVLRARPIVAAEFAVPYVILLIAAFLAGVATVFSGAFAVVVGVILALLVLAALAYTFGAAFSAVGETVRGDAPTPYFLRARRLFWRTLGMFGMAIVAALPAIIIGAIGFLMLAAAMLSSLAVASAPSGVLDAAFAVVAVFVLVALVTAPFIYCMEAGVFVGERRVMDAFRAAFSEAYRGGRFWRWILVTLIVTAFSLIGSLVRSIPGVVGAVLGLIASIALLWLSTALAFVNWQEGKGA